jgi:tight adherence protein C
LHAGVYSAAAPAIYMTVKLSLAVLGLFVFLPLGMLGTIEIKTALWGGAVAGGLGMVLPSLWLSRMKARRQRIVRNSLPDFLDLVVTCLEGGLSFEGALQRVTDELQTAHPELAGEMRVVQREIELGKTPEEAIRNFAARADLEVLRSLSTLVEQARRFGSSMANSLRIHADSLRFQREQRAEENAQKATVKILIPTFLFIFPPVLIVLAGPAAMEIHDKFAQPKPAAQAPNK